MPKAHHNPDQGSSSPRSLYLPACLLVFLIPTAWGAAQLGSKTHPHQVAVQATEKKQDVGLYQTLLDLNNPYTVMCVAAHPDDEDGASLTVLRRKFGVHTVSLFSTYGEGGQNAIGPELYEELGAIRARETREAAEIQGSEPYFLGLRDFGFSKSADEAFRIWGHDEALRRMVLKIRQLRPDVIITNHDTVSGHGHHQATGRLVLEAFDAAADPRRFPEQLQGKEVRPWQVQRIFVRVSYEGGGGSKSLEETARSSGQVVSMDPNERDNIRGQTYAEQALDALHRHATQGPWPSTVRPGGAPKISYRLARQVVGAEPVPSGAQTVLDGLRLPDAIAARIAPPTIEGRALTEYRGERAKVFEAIVAWRKGHQLGFKLDGIEEPHLDLINRRIQQALGEVEGISASLRAVDSPAVSNTSETFVLHLNNGGDHPADLIKGNLKEWGKSQPIELPQQLAVKSGIDVRATARVPGEEEISIPHSAHLYDARSAGTPVSALTNVQVQGESFWLATYCRIDIAPPVEIVSVTPSPLVLTPQVFARSSNVTVSVTNHQKKEFVGHLGIGASSERPGSFESLRLAPNETRVIKAKIDARKYVRDRGADAKPGLVSIRVLARAKLTPITERELKVVYSDAAVAPNLRVGYVRSTDFTLKTALDALGLESKELSVDDIRSSDLQKFDTIIIDNRGYQTHPELIGLNPRLLEYTRAGGTLIVFYHKANEWNPDPKVNRPQLGPYPITLGSSRVTDETAPVVFTEPQNAVLNVPNRIGEADFKDWIQERGLYFPKDWDEHYRAPIATGDPGESPLRGGLLACEYGKGHYIYTSIVWYRQLRAGVPGGYRIFANMISYGHATHNAAK